MAAGRRNNQVASIHTVAQYGPGSFEKEISALHERVEK